MLVQALAEYADSYLSDQLKDEAWEAKPVAFFVALDASGAFLNVIPNMVSTIRGKKTLSVPASLDIPRSPVARNAPTQSYPLLAADDIKYVLGVGSWTAEKDNKTSHQRHEAFVSFLHKAAEKTNDAVT